MMVHYANVTEDELGHTYVQGHRSSRWEGQEDKEGERSWGMCGVWGGGEGKDLKERASQRPAHQGSSRGLSKGPGSHCVV